MTPRHRLNRQAVAAPLSERDFQRQVTELAELYGWEWMHPRAGRTVDSWRTPMSGTMAQGWPDLVLIHPLRKRLLFVELKAETGRLTADQERVLRWVFGPLQSYLYDLPANAPSIEAAVWRPSDWDRIEAALGREAA